MRPRISQALVLPPFQRAGHGSALLRAAYAYCHEAYPPAKLTDITVEDPSENFRHLRDKVDAENCWSKFTRSFFEGSFTDKKAEKIRSELHLFKTQARRVYEILQLYTLQKNATPDLTPYRLAVKNRLIQPFMVRRFL